MRQAQVLRYVRDLLDRLEAVRFFLALTVRLAGREHELPAAHRQGTGTGYRGRGGGYEGSFLQDIEGTDRKFSTGFCIPVSPGHSTDTHYSARLYVLFTFKSEFSQNFLLRHLTGLVGIAASEILYRLTLGEIDPPKSTTTALQPVENLDQSALTGLLYILFRGFIILLVFGSKKKCRVVRNLKSRLFFNFNNVFMLIPDTHSLY